MTEPDAQRFLAAFEGPVTCRRDDGVSAGVTLIGTAAGGRGQRLVLTFMDAAPRDLPQTLPAPRVVALGGQRYRIASPPGEWLLRARAVHEHRDVGAAFYQAVPPRPVPWKKRMFWRLVLLLAGSRAGTRLLRALRAG